MKDYALKLVIKDISSNYQKKIEIEYEKQLI